VSTGDELPSADWRHLSGPFDIIGDVHGCADELIALLAELGYGVRLEGAGDDRRAMTAAPSGRRAFFVGDLVDRGPNSPDVLRIVMDMAAAGQAFSVIGNHDDKFMRWLKGANVTVNHGLERTIAQLDGEGEAIKARSLAFLATLPSHAWLDGGALAVAHAGIRESMLGQNYPKARTFGLYGDTSGRRGEDGLPERFNWAADYRGTVSVVYGHTPVAEAAWQNNTLCIDTGCVFGGKLTALRWPELEIVSVPARQTYADFKREFGHPPPRPPGQAKR
jgi:diadenosine tetraphosphatase ApaH/serine/threonine PP2A family protein phosphatase